MNKYESIIIINPAVEEERVNELTTKFTDMINKDGKVEKAENLGKKKLAYPVKKNAEGYYVVFFHYDDPKIEPLIQIMRMPLFFRFLKRRKIIKNVYETYNISINYLYHDISENSSLDVSEYTFGLACISLRIDMNLFKEYDLIW